MIHGIAVSTPGRICLFGEHQDYLRLPVISAAISLRLTISGTCRADDACILHLTNLQRVERFSIRNPLPFKHNNDYLRSAILLLQRRGIDLTHGFEGFVHSAIPIQAGASSSSALTVCWVHALTLLAELQRPLSPRELAECAYEAEVVEFQEAGGIMDQVTAAFGGVLFIDFSPDLQIERLNPPLGLFVVGDSKEPKDTQAILTRVKQGVLEIIRRLRNVRPGFSLRSIPRESAEQYRSLLTPEEFALLDGTLHNFALTQTAFGLLHAQALDHKRFGALLTEHHSVLRDVQRISTSKIERLLDAALDAGAYGGKINGSGGGGCMFAYAPEQPERVAEAIERAGGIAYIVRVDEGSRREDDIEA